MARKNAFDYRVQRGVAGGWMVTANGNVYRISRGKASGTWYVNTGSIGSTTLFNAGTLRDCIIFILAREQVV